MVKNWITDEQPKENGYYFITTDTVVKGEVDSDICEYRTNEGFMTYSNVYAWMKIEYPKPFKFK